MKKILILFVVLFSLISVERLHTVFITIEQPKLIRNIRV